MNCEAAQNLFGDYIEDRVDAPLRVVLDHHLSSCDPCRRDLDGTRELIHLFEDVKTLEAPSALRAQVLSRIAQQAPPRNVVWFDRWSIPIQRHRVPVAGMAVVALGLGLLFTRTSFKDARTLGPNLEIPLPGASARLTPTFTAVPEVRIAGLASRSLSLGEEIKLNVLLQPKSPLRNAKILLPSMTRNLKNGLVLDTHATATDRGLVVWQGSLRAGETLKQPIRLHATQPGVHRLLLHVEGDNQNFHRLILVPVSEGPQTAPSSFDQPLSTSQTLEQLARHFKVVIATDLSHERPQPTALQLSSPGRAVAQLAAQRGMQWSISDGVYNLYDSDGP